MSNLTDIQRIKCNAIIHAASAASGGVGFGLAQIPTSDNLIITPIQVAMCVSLGKVFGIELSKSSAQGFVAAELGALVGRAAAQVVGGWIPGYGNAVNCCTAVTITEVLGWNLVNEFAAMQDYSEGEDDYDE